MTSDQELEALTKKHVALILSNFPEHSAYTKFSREGIAELVRSVYDSGARAGMHLQAERTKADKQALHNAIDKVAAELGAMSKEEFDAELAKHMDGPVAAAIRAAAQGDG
jgi:hypothetical protein